MGQRHQIYVKLPKKYYNEENPNNKDSTVIGIHHQWIWGKTALTMLRNFIQFCLNANEYNPFITRYGDEINLLQALYSLDVQTGYFHSTCPLEDGETEDPRIGDNNNGITIIDLSDFTPEKARNDEKKCTGIIKYCFLSLGYLECLSDKLIETKEIEGTISDLFNNTKEFHFHPIGARDYIRLHYPDPKGNYECDSDCSCQKKGESKLKAIHGKSNLEHELACQGLIEFFTNHENLEVLTLAEVQAIFPKMFKKQIKQEVKAIEAPIAKAKKKAKKSSKK